MASTKLLLRLLETLLPRGDSDKKGTRTDRRAAGENTELSLLERFFRRYERHRDFTSTAESGIFQELLVELQESRVSTKWLSGASKEHSLGVLRCLRVLLRDEKLLGRFAQSTGSTVTIAQELQLVSSQYMTSLNGDDAELVQELLAELTNIMQKCSTLSTTHTLLLASSSHQHIAELVLSPDLPIACSSLSTLINFSKTEPGLLAVCDLNLCEVLVSILLHQQDAIAQQLASDLLLLLSQQAVTQQQLKESDLLSSLLTLFKSKDPHLQQRIVASLERLLTDTELLEEFRQAGGIPLVLSILTQHTENGVKEKTAALLCACCSLLARLSINDTCAVEIVKTNGVYLLALLAIPQTEQQDTGSTWLIPLHQQALRTLRFLFSLEQNRQLFKQLFPTDVLEKFIDIGHYVHDLGHYLSLATTLYSLPELKLSAIHKNIAGFNQHKQHLCSIAGYQVIALLGSGAYGSVYKARKGPLGSLFAMKEISTTHALLGKTLDSREESIGSIMSEVAMIKQQLAHPNIVCYHKCFQEGNHLYIVMELLEGAPLSEHITSFKEKSLRFSEDRIWHLFSQIIRALRYLHKQKRIVHRDLKPANIMVGDKDKLTITDFGLAKQKKEFSVMNSTVGTMLYWCPELVQSEAYDEKADVWAAGCILYEMAALRAPFHSSNNILALATKIAEVDYERLPSGEEAGYSPLVGEVVERCLTYDKTTRPDSVQIGSMIAGKMMELMDDMAHQRDRLNKRLTRERESRIRHLHDAVSSEQKYQHLLTQCKSVESISSARKRLSFSAITNDSVSTAPSLSELGSPSISSDFTASHLTASPAIHPETPYSPLSDGVFEDEGTKLCYRKASSAGVIQRISPFHYQLHSRGAVGSAAPKLRYWASSSCGTENGHSQSISPVISFRRQSIGMVSIPSKHLREVSDPVGELLSQLHKIVYLAKIPLSSSSAGVSIVRQYERALFGTASHAGLLKSEMRKLSTHSLESVSILPHCPNLLSRALKEAVTVGGVPPTVTTESVDHTTYEQLHVIIETLIKKHSSTTTTTI